jgi:hypothetical protein
MQGLIQLYQFHYSVLKDELGEDPNLSAQAATPRVTTGNIETAQQVAANATDYMYDAYVECMKQTARKISCLLHKSVTFGAKAYRHLLKQEDVQTRIFNTDVRLLPTGQEIMMLDAKMNQALASNPQFAMYIDTFKILRIAKEDVKLAEEYYRISMKKMLETQQAQAQMNQQQTIQGQIAAAQAAEAEKRKTLEMDLAIKKQISDMQTANDLKKTMIAGLFGIYQKGLQVPQELKALEQEVLQNIALPLFAENMGNEAAMAQGMQEAQMQQQEGMEEGQEEMPQEEQMPEEQVQEEQVVQ